MNLDFILSEISRKFEIDFKKLQEFVKEIDTSYSNENKLVNDNHQNNNKEIILPFCGFIDTAKCNAVIYNHGLYTQCNNLANDFCKKCKTNRKYGTIQERAKYELGKFTPDNSRYEIPYDKFIKKMKYDLDDVKRELAKKNLRYQLIDNLKTASTSRGRPKKTIVNLDDRTEDCEEEIEVEKVSIEGRLYYKTSEDVLLDIRSHDICGILVENSIISINK